jgi:outer membrane biosynthesis protein TonB
MLSLLIAVDALKTQLESSFARLTSNPQEVVLVVEPLVKALQAEAKGLSLTDQHYIADLVGIIAQLTKILVASSPKLGAAKPVPIKPVILPPTPPAAPASPPAPAAPVAPASPTTIPIPKPSPVTPPPAAPVVTPVPAPAPAPVATPPTVEPKPSAPVVSPIPAPAAPATPAAPSATPAK